MLTGIAGATLLSFPSEFRNYGYILFLMSGIASLYILRKDNKELFILNGFFCLININGIYQFLL
jgi:hypothetical protein